MTDHKLALVENSKQKTTVKPFKPLFRAGLVVATSGANKLLQKTNVPAVALLRRHIAGDWGECCEEDAETNNQSVRNGMRILSVYTIGDDEEIWIITEADRSATTLLLPEEY